MLRSATLKEWNVKTAGVNVMHLMECHRCQKNGTLGRSLPSPRNDPKVSSPSISYLLTLCIDKGSRPLPSSSEAVCLTHTLHFSRLPTILYIFHMKTTGRQETNVNQAHIWWSQSEATDWYCCTWNVWSYLLMPTLQMEDKATLKPLFSSGDGLQVSLRPIRGAPGEMFMRACFV